MTDKPIDLDHLARFTGGDDAIRSEVFAIFREQADLWLRILVPTSDDQTWSSAAHTMKGAANGVGAMALGTLCGQAEVMVADAGSPVARSVIAQEIRAELAAVLAMMTKVDQRAAVSS